MWLFLGGKKNEFTMEWSRGKIRKWLGIGWFGGFKAMLYTTDQILCERCKVLKRQVGSIVYLIDYTEGIVSKANGSKGKTNTS